MVRIDGRRLTRRRSQVAAAAAVVTMSAMLVGCGGNADSSPKGSDVLVVSDSQPVVTLDPAMTPSRHDASYVANLYVTLIKNQYAKDGAHSVEQATDFEPYLAKSWSISDDELVYTFKLNRDWKFSDGNPQDAEAVKFSLERSMELPGFGDFPWNQAFTGADPTIKSVEAPDATTVVITLNKYVPSYEFLAGLAATGYVQNPTALKENGVDEPGTVNQWAATHSFGGGPYVVKSFNPGRDLVLAANPEFAGPKPLRATVSVNFVSNEETQLLQLKNGTTDVAMGLSTKSIASLEDDPDLKVASQPWSFAQFVALPTKVRPFDDSRVRQALAYATPYKALLADVAHGYGGSYFGPLPPGVVGANEEIQKAHETDPDKALALIREANVQKPVDLDLVVAQGDATGLQTATVLQDAWKPLGVNLKIQQVSSAAYGDVVNSDNKTAAYIAQPSYVAPILKLGSFAAAFTVTCAGFNPANFCDAEVDEAVQQAIVAPTLDEQQPYLDVIQKKWVQEAPIIPTFAQDYVLVHGAELTSLAFGNNSTAFSLWG